MKRLALFGLLTIAVLALTVTGASAKTFMSIGGGPEGGTFKVFAAAMYTLVKDASKGELEITPEATGGSAENLRRLDSGDVDFGIVYAADCYLGSKGLLPNDDKKYEKVLPMAYLYGAPGQLVVKADSNIMSAKDLEGKRVGVGNAGSGAALSAERFFKQLGIWDKMDKQFLGYSAAAADFQDNKLDAFWVLVGYPTAAIIEAAAQNKIRLIDVYKDAEAAGFFKEHPYYAPTTIPAGTYQGVDQETKSFMDSALLCTNKDVDQEVVYQVLKYLYSPEGMQHLVQAKMTFKEMNLDNAFQGAPTPLAPGAVKFWTEAGKTVPDNLK